MSKLDTLWFDLDLNDQPLLKKLEAAKKRLVDLGVEAKIKVEVNQGELKKSVKEALQNGGTPYKIDVVVDKSKMSKVVKEALDKAGYSQRHDFSTSDARYEKTMADIQTKATEAQARAQVEAQKAADAHALAQEKLAQATLRTERAQQSLANAHERASQSVNSHLRSNLRLGGSLTGLISLSGDLRNQIGMLVSVYTVEHLLKNVVQIGGEFEKQKLAMGSMLGSLEQADDIFNRMKNLALTSPYNFKDLSNYSRQLTAYGTDYKDLYDTTNRLADISAGLGGDMSRLVLAYSQVKSAAYLRGQEMRQFTEFGVALPDLLAQKYSKAEHRIVTAGDVIERVSKRMVSFNDVKDVLWQQTDKGGKFYGMQNVLAQSTSGMASNLKDAIDTMYYDIANSNSGMIKGAIKDITELVSHWRELTSVLVAGTSVYTVYRLVMAAHNRMIGLNNSSTVQSIMLEKKEEASILRKASAYRTLTPMEKERLMMSRELTLSDLQQLAANKSLSSEQLVRLARSGRITAAQALEVASLYGLNEAQVAYLLSLSKTGVAMNKWERMMNSGFILKMKAGFADLKATIFSLPNVLMMGATAIVSFILDYNQRMSQLKDSNKQMMKDSEDSAKNIGKFLTENPLDFSSNLSSDEMDNLIEEYRKQLEENPLDMSHFLTNVDSISNTTSKIAAMRMELEHIKQVDEEISKTGNPFIASEQSMEHLLPDWLIGLEDKIVPIINLSKDKSLKGLFEDLEDGASRINRAMNDVSSNQLAEAIKQMKKDTPEAAKMLDELSNSGANVDEVVKKLIETGNKGALINIFKSLGINDISNYETAFNNVSSRIDEILNGLGSKFKNIQNGKATDQEIIQFKKYADAVEKALNLSGDSLDLWNFRIEEMVSRSDKNLKYETKSWSVFSDTIKQIAEKKGIDLNKASNKQWLQLVNDAKSQCGQIYPWMRTFLSKLIALANNNPIQFVIGIKSTVTGRQPLTGRGKQLAENFGISSLLGYDALTNIKTDKDAADYVKNKYDAYQEDLKNAKANRKSVKAIQQKWDNFKNIMNSQMDVDFIIGGEKTGKKKIKGTKEDTFLKDMENRLDQIKEVMDVYKKWKDTGISEAKAIGYADNSGILAKGTFNGMTSEGDINAWYKKVLNNLTKMMNAAKSTPERKKYTASIAKLIGEFDQKAIKDKLDDMGKQIEKTISDVVKKWDFYKKVKDTTDNEGLAAQLAFGGALKDKNVLEDIKSRYGQDELAKKSGVSFDTFVGMSDSQLDAKGLSSLKKYRDEYISENDKLKQETVSNLLDLVQKNKDYAQQILDVRNKLAKDLSDIEANRPDLEKSGIDVDKLKQNTTNKANEKIGNLEFSQFKETSEWVKIFDDLGRVSTKTLDDMINKLEVYAATNKMSVQDTKELIEALKKIRNEEISRNPFSSASKSIGDYFYWRGVENKAKLNGGYANAVVGKDENGKPITKQVTTDEAKDNAKAASDDFANSMKKCIDEMQKWNNALSLLGSTVEALGGGTGVSDAAGVAGGMLSGASSMAALGPYGMAAGAAMGAITSIAQLHDKKLDRAIEKSKERVQELNLAYKSIEDSLKYNLGNAAEGSLVNNSEIQKVKDAQANVARMKSKGKLSIFDLKSLQKSEKILKKSAAAIKYLDENDKDNYGNAYNYQRNLYKEQLAELEKQKQAEEDKKKTDQSKVNDYNSRIQEMETKIAQFSEDLADTLYGINIKDWASQFGDALFEAWQKGESGADAFQKKADEILSNLVKSWWKTQFIESAFKNVKTDLFGEDGMSRMFGTDNKLTQEELEKLATDVMGAQDRVTKSISNLDQIYAYLQTKGIDIKNTTESSASNAISGITEQEANILAAYADAIHQDTYNIRIDIRKLVEDKGEESNNIMQAQLQQLQAIGTNTYRNAEIVAGIKSMLNDFALGNQKIHIA